MSASESSSQSASTGGPRTRRPWAPAEDAVLQALVSHYGDARGSSGAWKEISAAISNRTAKGRWTAEEDQTLLAAYTRLGPVWHDIAALIPGRKDDQCSKRYNEILNPLVSNRLTDWTAREDDLLRQGVHALGHRWSAISSRIPGRPPLTCRNRWRTLSRSASMRRSQELLASIQSPADLCHETSSEKQASAEFSSLFSELDDQLADREHDSHGFIASALYDTPFSAGTESQSAIDLTDHQPLLLGGMEAQTSPEQTSFAASRPDWSACLTRPSHMHHGNHSAWMGPPLLSPDSTAALPNLHENFSAGQHTNSSNPIHQIVHVHHHYHYHIAKPDAFLPFLPSEAEARREEPPKEP
ncbi:transcription factor [Grosmannia clavigera kw1407]|uniref:Transcription factor n=1 Tax=Grosmannia clavigera (strain kw1407 / UAMH 11150) TaxID=655863 RepID=F0X7N7_GROCL|nr:transcription factor [Grosmannia clavigera kw1407]EFX06463.1 transcription factor [Grosmannia clavigera kw1407]